LDLKLANARPLKVLENSLNLVLGFGNFGSLRVFFAML